MKAHPSTETRFSDNLQELVAALEIPALTLLVHPDVRRVGERVTRATSFELKPAAEALGVSRSVLYQLIEKCPRVRKAADLGREEIEQALASHDDDVAVARTLEVSLQGLRMRMKALGLR